MTVVPPVTVVLWRADLDLGPVSGPVYLDAAGDTLWVAGGGRGDCFVFVRRGATWSRVAKPDAQGLRSVLALDDRVALVSGEYGVLARTEDAGASFDAVATGTRACLYALSRDAAGTIWLGGDDGLRVSHDGGRSFTAAASPPGRVFRVVPWDAAGGMVVGEHALATIDGDTVFASADAVLNDAASAPDGAMLVVGDAGRAWFADAGRELAPVDLGTRADLERVVVSDGELVVACSDGALRTSADGITWKAVPVFDGLRISSILPYGGGWLVGGWRQEGPPYRYVGALAYLGPHAPRTANPIRGRLPIMGAVAAPPPPSPTDELLKLMTERSRWPSELTADRLRALFAAGADVHARGPYGATALALATQPTYYANEALLPLELLDVFLDAGADPNACDQHGQTPLTRVTTVLDAAAAVARSVAIMKHLVRRGARVPEGKAVLNAHRRCAECEVLLEAGAQVDSVTAHGDRALHSAAKAGSPEHARLFLAHGAEVNALDVRGRTPLRIALREIDAPWVRHADKAPSFREVIKLLREAGGAERVPYTWRASEPFSPRPFDDSALRVAAGNVATPIAKLLARGSDSVQDLIADLHHLGEPERCLQLLRALASILPPPTTLRIAGDLVVEWPWFWNGDVDVEGHIRFKQPSAVIGTVTAGGVVADSDNDARVTIAGDLRCQALYTSGDFAVGGAIEARDVVLGYYNDFVLTADVIRARVVIEDDHATNAAVEADHHLVDPGDSARSLLRGLFVDEVFDGDASLDNRALFERLRNKLPVFR